MRLYVVCLFTYFQFTCEINYELIFDFFECFLRTLVIDPILSLMTAIGTFRDREKSVLRVKEGSL